MIDFGSVCSGIEAASVAWHPLGWKAAWLAEIEPFPCAVLAHHYPDTPNLGDMTALPERIRAGEVPAPTVFTGGTPCQAFSVAGKRESLTDARGNLSLTFCEIANAIDAVRHADGREPCVVLWENVPGVLSTSDNAFGCFLGALAGADDALVAPGGRWADAGLVLGPRRAVAWRILDAQFFGLAQRRRRVFVVASARDGFDPGAVLLEFDGLRRDSAPRREARQGSARGAADGFGAGCLPETVGTLCADTHPGSYTGQDAYTGRLIPSTAHTLRAEGFDASEDGTGRGTPLVPVAIAPTITATNDPSRSPQSAEVTAQVAAVHGVSMQVRRLTPEECEALQGFLRGYTAIPWRKKPAADCPDGPRYKALGNSWAVPCVRWIGARIDAQLRGDHGP